MHTDDTTAKPKDGPGKAATPSATSNSSNDFAGKMRQSYLPDAQATLLLRSASHDVIPAPPIFIPMPLVLPGRFSVWYDECFATDALDKLGSDPGTKQQNVPPCRSGFDGSVNTYPGPSTARTFYTAQSVLSDSEERAHHTAKSTSLSEAGVDGSMTALQNMDRAGLEVDKSSLDIDLPWIEGGESGSPSGGVDSTLNWSATCSGYTDRKDLYSRNIELYNRYSQVH